LLAVTARGPLGLARICGPRLHAILDIVVALAVAAAPILPVLRPDITGILVVEVAAVAWIRLATLTRYTRLPVDAAPASPPTAQALPADPALPPPPGAVALRTLGFLAGRSARRLPEAEEKLHGGARQAGRHAARLQRAWRKPPDGPS
jgi:hypothetical protein